MRALVCALALGGCGGEAVSPSLPAPGAAEDAARAMDSTPVDASLPDEARPPLPAVPEGCNPIAAEWDCLLPFPSDVFRVPDPQTVSGFRVEVPLSARPVHAFSGPIDLQALHPADGFSTIQQIIVALPYEVAAGELVTLDGDYAGSARGEGRTVLLNALTGAFVEHIAEQDPRSEDREHAGLILRPLVRLEDQTRYIVALRSLHAADGSVVPTPLARKPRSRRGTSGTSSGRSSSPKSLAPTSCSPGTSLRARSRTPRETCSRSVASRLPRSERHRRS